MENSNATVDQKTHRRTESQFESAYSNHKHEIAENLKLAYANRILLLEELIPLLSDTLGQAKFSMEEIEQKTDVQNVAVNSVKTGLSVVTIASTVLLFTPFFPFGIGGLIGTGVGSVATLAGDEIANHYNGKDIQEIMNKSKIEAEKFEENEKAFLKYVNLIAKILEIENADQSDFYDKFIRKIFLKLDHLKTLDKKSIDKIV